MELVVLRMKEILSQDELEKVQKKLSEELPGYSLIVLPSNVEFIGSFPEETTTYRPTVLK